MYYSVGEREISAGTPYFVKIFQKKCLQVKKCVVYYLY